MKMIVAIIQPEKLDAVKQSFELTTIYPGLLIGSGYNHEIAKQDDELKLGFFFDYTTGLPCIPGSSVKGVLRDACEKNNGEYVISIFKELKEGERDSEVKEIIDDFSKKQKPDKIFGITAEKKLSKFVESVFEGKDDDDTYLKQSERDIFFDAFPVKSENRENLFLANDFITHHESPFKNPNPVQFLKILPQVKFRFNFRLLDNCIPAEIKKELFRQIFLDLGVGAKTNVGYGQFTPFSSAPPDTASDKVDHSESKETEKKPKKSLKFQVSVSLSKNESFKGKVDKIEGNYIYFSFVKNDENCIVSKKADAVYKKLSQKGFAGSLEPGSDVTIFIQSDFNTGVTNVNFQVWPPGDKS